MDAYIDPALLGRYEAALRDFLQETTGALAELEREVPQLAVSIKKRPEAILSMLARVLSFQQISFLEITYSLPGEAGKRPGIRFWLEGPLQEKRLRAILFGDTRVWDVSYGLEKLYTELASFYLEDGEIVAHPAAALGAKGSAGPDWRVLLRDVLSAPLP